jgi:hypothetical protein
MVARCTQFILARGQIIQAERRFRSQLFSAEKFDVIKLSRLVNQVATTSQVVGPWRICNSRLSQSGPGQPLELIAGTSVTASTIR